MIRFNQVIVRLIVFVAFAVGSLTALAQNSERVYQAHTKGENGLNVITDKGVYQIQFYNDNIVETAFVPLGEKPNEESHAVVMKSDHTKGRLIENNNDLRFLSKGLEVIIQKSPFGIRYEYKGKTLISEKDGYVKTDSTENIDFTIAEDEILFGGGARVLGMNRRGHRLQLYNRAHYGYGTHSELMNYTMPVVVSSKKYAVHFDNAPIGYLDLDSKKTNTLRYETISGRKVYQVIAADTWEDFTYEFTNLTGRQPMLPRWALGNFSSRFGYHSQKETLHTVDQFLKDSIPVDAIILDLYWFGKNVKGDMGNLAFHRDSFPNPEAMISELKSKGVKTVLITEPFVLTTSNRWEEVVKEGVLGTDTLGNPYTYDFFFGNTGLIDVFKPKAQEWFWDIYKNLNEIGVAGWWGDLGEPEVHPSGLQHVNGSADEVHNIYGHYWAKLVYDGYKKDFPEQRPFILMRAGAVGSQRYGMVPWTGDVSRSWDGLIPQTEISLQMGLQGIAYMHSDLGGFAGANLDDELYTRWLQYGVFQPIYRPHAQEDVPSEPVFREEKTKELAKKSIQLRYQLMPYNYTLAYENHKTGLPLMRPLFFDEEDNKQLLNVSDTYLWGDAFLVSTVTKAGLKQKEVYLPSESVWFDFKHGRKYYGGASYVVNLHEDHIPVFVRAGSFIPMKKGMINTEGYNLKTFDLHYYADQSVKVSEGQLYNDNGTTPGAVAKGKYELLHFQSDRNNRSLELTVNTQTGKNYTSSNKEINWVIHNITSKPKRIKVGDDAIDFTWNKSLKTLKFKSNLDSGNEQTIKIKLAK